MGLWDDVSGWFGGRDIDYSYGEPDIGAERFTPEYDPYVDIPIAGVESAYGPEVGIPWYGSLWGAFKEAGTQLIKSPLLPALISRDKKGLQYQFPRAPEAPYDRQDGVPYTPYPRATTGTTPSPVPVMAARGVSPMILIAAAGAAYLLLIKKGRK